MLQCVVFYIFDTDRFKLSQLMFSYHIIIQFCCLKQKEKMFGFPKQNKFELVFTTEKLLFAEKKIKIRLLAEKK